MTSVHRYRMAMAKYLGQTITPEIAAAIEVEAFSAPDESIDPTRFAPKTCGSIVFAVESFRAIVQELHPLHEEHWKQTEGFRHHIPLNPDYQALRADERAGGMVQITARREGELVGHLRLYLRKSRHTQTLVATEDAMYLQPDVRGGRTAMRMVEYSEGVLRVLGVTSATCTAKLVNGTARFFEGMGYKPVATELVKFLED